MDHDSENHYKELLNQWKNDEDNIREDLKKIGSDVKEFGMYVREISTDVKDLTKRFSDLVASPVTTARETNDEGEYYNSNAKRNIIVQNNNCRHFKLV